MINKVILVGHLGAKPLLRGDNENVAAVSLATNERWKDDDGKPMERTEWHNLIFFGQSAKFAAMLDKGALVYIEGRLQTREWQDKDGNDRKTTEVIVGKIQALSAKRDAEAEPKATEAPPAKAKIGNPDFDDDDIPF